ncbi:MAG TPA: 30S ribosomal protein S6 [Patescibacteria group bacterium]|nr:30S ribosomal protein S6 [Patescibacteria group bacterium]
MQKYELLFILPGTLDDKEADARSQEIVQLVQNNSEETELVTMGKNRLAYPIRHIRYGYFYTVLFSAEPEQVQTLEEKIRLMRDVLRTMISYFNTRFTASQKITYTTDALGVTTMTERDEERVARAMSQEVPGLELDKEIEPGKVASKATRDIDKVDIEDINKKLDQLMEGNIIPGI